MIQRTPERVTDQGTLLLVAQRREAVDRLHLVWRLGPPHTAAVAMGLDLVEANEAAPGLAGFHHPAHDLGVLRAAREGEQGLLVGKEGNRPQRERESIPDVVPAVARGLFQAPHHGAPPSVELDERAHAGETRPADELRRGLPD